MPDYKMVIELSVEFRRQYKKADVRIQNAFKKRILIFKKNPLDPQLNNHELKREWEGYRSIDVTADWRAIYEELEEGEELFAYFSLLDTHNGLYGKKKILDKPE